jgi:hypothetical protein
VCYPTEHEIYKVNPNGLDPENTNTFNETILFSAI